MAVTKQQLAQWSREFAAKNPDKVSGAGSTAQNTTTKKSSVTKEQLSQWSREFDKKEAQRQAEPEQRTRDKALQQYTERHISDMGEVDARNDTSLAGRVSTGKKPLSQAAPAATEKALDMGRKWGVPAKSGNVLENVGSGAMAYGTGRAQELRASFAKDSVPDEFDRINQWMDTGDNKNLADAVRRVDNTHGAYTDADLIQKGGWTQAQIDEARKMNAALDAIPAWQRDVRRAANTIGGIGDTVAAAPVLGAEYGVQAGKNIDATLKNWKQVEQEVKGDEHAQSLFNLLTDIDMDYKPTWPESRNRELISMGYNSKEIREMRQKLAGLEVSDGIDKNQSVGYQLYDRGQKLTAAAQSGLSPAQRAVAGAVTSAAENLAIAAGGDGVAWILPMLSAQGAAEAMGQSAEKGESAGKALGGGLAKFGAGWAINSVGAADLAKTMGSDYAKDTMAGQIADWVQGLAGSSELAQRYPAVAAAISGGIDNSMDNLRAAKENAAALKTESAAEKQGVRFSILKDKAGETYIKIDEDILKDVPQEEWKSTVKQAIKERFPNGFKRNDWTIENTKESRKEFVWSKYTKALQWESANAYADKMQIAANLDEIIRTADEVYREPANHKNAEAFNRGKIKIQVGQNAYEADVLTAIKTDQREIFYDIVDIKPIKIETSGKAHIESEDSRSSGPEVSVEASGGTVTKTQSHDASRLPEASKQSIARTSDESKRTDEAVKKTVRFQLSESRRNQSELQKESRELERQRRALKEERANWQESNEVRAIEEKKKAYGLFSEKGKAFRASEEYQSYLEKRKEFNRRGAELESRIGEVNDKLRQAQAEVENARQAVKQEQQKVYDTKAKAAGGKPEYRRKLAVKQFGTTDRFERAGYILPDGRMLNFAQNDGTRDTDHREILDVFGPAEVPNGTEALNKFLADGNVRVMAEAPGVDIAAKTPPTEQQLRQIRAMVEQLGSEKRRFTIDISTTDGRVAASKEYSGKVDADKVVREIREYYKTGELPAESELARFRYQRAEQADRDAKQNQQRQASRVLAEKAAAFDTLNQFFGLTKNTRLSDAALESLAIRWTKTNGSRADRTKLANETRALVEYLRSEGADMAKAQGLAETLAGEVLDEATYRNTELWNQYPDLHDLTYTVDKNGKAKAELVKRYGSWTEAVAEARRHGVKLRQAEGYRDGNPAEQYEAIVNDTRAVGGVKESAAALFRSAAQEAGVAGAASMESTEWLDVLMNVHDTIKPRMMSRFADAAEYEDAKVELAGRMIGDIMSHPEMTDAEAVFEGILKHNREVAAMAAGNEERAAEVTKGLKSVQQAQRKAFADRMRANSRSQSDEVKSVSRAEQQLNENLETLGAQVSTAAGLDEKLTALREAYDRE